MPLEPGRPSTSAQQPREAEFRATQLTGDQPLSQPAFDNLRFELSRHHVYNSQDSADSMLGSRRKCCVDSSSRSTLNTI